MITLCSLVEKTSMANILSILCNHLCTQVKIIATWTKWYLNNNHKCYILCFFSFLEKISATVSDIHCQRQDLAQIKHRSVALNIVLGMCSVKVLVVHIYSLQMLTLNSSMIAVRTFRHVSTPRSSRGKCSGKSTSENRVWSGRANNNGGWTSLGNTWIWNENRKFKWTVQTITICLCTL